MVISGTGGFKLAEYVKFPKEDQQKKKEDWIGDSIARTGTRAFVFCTFVISLRGGASGEFRSRRRLWKVTRT